MKIITFDKENIVRITELTETEKKDIEGQFPTLYHPTGLYIPGDCLSSFIEIYPNLLITRR